MYFSAQQPQVNIGSKQTLVLINEVDNSHFAKDADGNDTEDIIPDYQYDGVWLTGVLSGQDVLPKVKEYERQLINTFDKSASVNSFVIGGKTMWLDRDTRNNLSHSVTIWKDAGNETYTLDLRDYGTSIEINCDTLLAMLNQLEAYAVKCFNATSAHLNAVAALESIEDVLNYDYTTGYPDKLEFTL